MSKAGLVVRGFTIEFRSQYLSYTDTTLCLSQGTIQIKPSWWYETVYIYKQKVIASEGQVIASKFRITFRKACPCILAFYCVKCYALLGYILNRYYRECHVSQRSNYHYSLYNPGRNVSELIERKPRHFAWTDVVSAIHVLYVKVTRSKAHVNIHTNQHKCLSLKPELWVMKAFAGRGHEIMHTYFHDWLTL